MNKRHAAPALLLACLLATAAGAAESASTQSFPGTTSAIPFIGTAVFPLKQLRALAGKNGFKPYEGNPVLAPGGKGTWDAGALGSMTVVKVKDIYHLYYEAWGVRSKKAWSQEEYNSLQIGHATSADGVHWMKDPANPVVPKGREENAPTVRTARCAWQRRRTV